MEKKNRNKKKNKTIQNKETNKNLLNNKASDSKKEDEIVTKSDDKYLSVIGKFREDLIRRQEQRKQKEEEENKRLSINIESFGHLRAFALLAVMMFHILPHRLPGGFLAVTIFFALSGFLMARKMDILRDFDRKSASLMIEKRIKKLYPPLLLALALSLTYSLFFAKKVFFDSVKNFFGIILSVDNIAQILKGGSYFDMHGNFSMFGHMWTLSIQMQFIILFIIIELLFRKFKLAEKNRAIFYFTVSVLSMALMVFLGIKATDVNRIYYGTDTRLYSFTLGIFTYYMAKILVKNEKAINSLKENMGQIIWAIFFALLLISMLLSFSNVDGKSLDTYIYHLPSFNIIVCLTLLWLYIMEIAEYNEESEKEEEISVWDTGESLQLVDIVRLFKKSLKYLASHSYELYIWQFIVTTLCNYRFASSNINPKAVIGLSLIVIFALAHFSKLIFKKLANGEENKKINKILVAASLILSMGFNLVPNRGTNDIAVLKENLSENEKIIAERNANALENNNIQNSTLLASESSALKKEIAPVDMNEEYDNKILDFKQKVQGTPLKWQNMPKNVFDVGVSLGLKSVIESFEESVNMRDINYALFIDKDEAEKLKNMKVFTIGDSVIINADPYLYDIFGTYYLDAKVSRQMYQGINVLKNAKNTMPDADFIVLALGTNGDFSEDILKGINAEITGTNILVVGTVMPEPWEKTVNEKLEKFAKEHENIYFANWFEIAKERPELLHSDMTHPQPGGAKIYAQMIAKNILNPKD